MQLSETAEYQRLYGDSGARAWLHWGPYLSERAWGTVREDYSADGNAWSYLPHDHARSRAYRWNEDGLGGICDEHQHLCFALALARKLGRGFVRDGLFVLLPLLQKMRRRL